MIIYFYRRNEAVEMHESDLKSKMDDHALEAVPVNERKSWIQLANNPMGVCSTLLIMLFGALATFTAGLLWGLVAGVICLIVGTIFGTLLGNIARKEGLSSTVLTRLYGFGVRGSAVSSLVFCFMILGMLALENALLYHGVLFFFNMESTLFNVILIYGIFTLCWVLFSIFGINVVYRIASIFTISFLALLVYIIVDSAVLGNNSIGEILSFGPQFSESTGVMEFIGAINILIGATGAMTLVSADSSRYARTKKDVFMIAFCGNLMQSIIILIAGGVVAYVGMDAVVQYYVTNSGLSIEQARAIVLDDMASFFIILGGAVGFILMFLANGKAQILNTYSGSLALTNLFSALGWKGNRAIFVVVANFIALIMIYFNILSLVESWLDALGVLTTSMATIVIVDYYIVRKKMATEGHPSTSENVNIAGIVTLIISTITSLSLSTANIFPIPFVAATVLCLVIYPVMRIYVFKPTMFTKQQSNENLQPNNDMNV